MEHNEKERFYDIDDSIHSLLQLRRKEDMNTVLTPPDVKQKVIHALDTARWILIAERTRISKEISHVK